MTAEPNAGTPGSGPTPNAPRPANEFLTEMQISSGALAAGSGGPDTPNGGNQPGTAAGGAGGGGKSPAPSSPAPGGFNEQVLAALNKVNQRLDAQGAFLMKVQGTQAQMRQDFEQRYSAPRRDPNGQFAGQGQPGGDEFNSETMMNKIAEGVLAKLGTELRPLVEQTAATSAVQRIMQATYDPAIKQMVDELPPNVRAGLAKSVHRMVGDKMFQEANPLFDEVDPVAEAIEIIHHRTVVKAGGGRAGGPSQPNPQRGGSEIITPLPEMGGRSNASPLSDSQKAFQEMVGTDGFASGLQYPPGVHDDVFRR